jgi:hypothetical protein
MIGEEPMSKERKRIINSLLKSNEGTRVVLAKYFESRGWKVKEKVVGFHVQKASVKITLGAFGWELSSPRYKSSGTYRSWKTLMEQADLRLPLHMRAIRGHMPPFHGQVG